jgi:hypothetical protein
MAEVKKNPIYPCQYYREEKKEELKGELQVGNGGAKVREN